MTDQPTESTAVVVQPARARMVVADVIPIFDTARFDHYGRIATVVWQAQMMPPSLTTEKVNGSDVSLDPDTIKARAFHVVALADRWNCDPFQLMGACSFIHGRLMVEGKVIAAVIDAELGVALNYEFGKWDAKKESVDLSQEGEGDYLGVRVSLTLPGESQPRFIDGGVGSWKTDGTKSPWKMGSFKRMLRYRGAREWCRAYKASLLIGIVGDDEMDDLRDRRDIAAGPAPGLDPGFPADHRLAAPQTAADPKPPKAPAKPRKAASEAPADAEEAKPGNALVAEHIHPDTGQVFETREELDAAMRPTETGSAKAADQAPASSDSATDVSGDSAAATSSPAPPAEPSTDGKPAAPEEDVEEGVAAPGDTYFLAGEPFDPKTGRRHTYQDGVLFSSATRKALEKGDILIYATHAPARVEGEQANEQVDQANEQAAGDFPGDRPATEQTTAHPFIEAIAKINEAPHWDAAKQAVRKAAGTEAWAKDDGAGKTQVRSALWDRYCQLRDDGAEVVPIIGDLSLMGLWIEFACSSKVELDGMWRGFFRNAAYTGAPDADKSRITEAMMNKAAEFEGK